MTLGQICAWFLAAAALGIALPAQAADQDSPAPPPAAEATPQLAMGEPAHPAGTFALPAPVPGPEKTVYDGNYLIIAAGGGFTPNYDGSRTSSFTPGFGIKGRIGPISFDPRPAGLALDFVPDHGGKVTWAIGPEANYAVNRHSDITDPVVAKLGTLAPWVQAGVAASVSVHKLLTPADSLSFSTDARWDITGHGAGRVIGTSIGYYTPLTHGVLITTSLFGDFADGAYARYNYSISAAGSAASGLPVYDAHGGLKDIGWQTALAIDLNGNLMDGGFAVLAGFSYTRLEGSAAETPITSLRGTPSQWSFGAGLGYSF